MKWSWHQLCNLGQIAEHEVLSVRGVVLLPSWCSVLFERDSNACRAFSPVPAHCEYQVNGGDPAPRFLASPTSSLTSHSVAPSHLQPHLPQLSHHTPHAAIVPVHLLSLNVPQPLLVFTRHLHKATLYLSFSPPGKILASRSTVTSFVKSSLTLFPGKVTEQLYVHFSKHLYHTSGCFQNTSSLENKMSFGQPLMCSAQQNILCIKCGV